MSENKIKALIIEPMKYPEVKEISGNLASMQAVVGGYIEEIMPFDDEVAIVCNEEGKNEGLPLNRAIYNEDGEMIDIIAGSFFICSAPLESEKFESLNDEQLKKYASKFKYPEQFYKTTSGIKALQIIPKNKDNER